LGAGPSDLIQMFLRQTAIIAGVGIAVGLILGVGATSIFQAQFYGIQRIELRVLLPVAITMMLVAMAIAYIAARPWITTNPIDAVRHN
jgi:putative ABC transport system permease protein